MAGLKSTILTNTVYLYNLSFIPLFLFWMSTFGLIKYFQCFIYFLSCFLAVPFLFFYFCSFSTKFSNLSLSLESIQSILSSHYLHITHHRCKNLTEVYLQPFFVLICQTFSLYSGCKAPCIIFALMFHLFLKRNSQTKRR